MRIIMRVPLFGVLLFGLTLFFPPSASHAAETLRIGVLKFGTVNWELTTIQRRELDVANGVRLEVVPFAGGAAAKVAFQGGDVDMIVSDYLWVSRQRASGRDMTFAPYSSTVGALMAHADSEVRDLSDLPGKKIGVAGGPLDKGWLILRALAQARHGADLLRDADPHYGAPPLINQKLQQGELDVVLSFWHWCARLEAKGYRRILPVEEAAKALGVERRVALLGYVFRESWARENPQIIDGFLRASRAAKEILRDDDAEWERLREDMKAKDEATFRAFRARFREGILAGFGDADIAAAKKLYALLAGIGGSKLVGKSATLADGVFWPGARF